MSEASEPPVNPEPTPPAADPAPPPAEDTTAPEYLPQKRRHKRSAEPAELDLSEGEDDEILILGTLLQRLLAKKQAEVPEPETRTRINRFVQKNTAPLPAAQPPSPAADESADTPAAGEPPGGTSAIPLPARPLPKLTPRAVQSTDEDQWAASSLNRSRGILYFAFCTGLAIVAFLVGRGASHPAAASGTSAAATPAPQWNATLLGKLDQVLAADQSGNLKDAKAQALDLKKQIGSSLELDLYLGSLTTRLGHTNDAEADLSRLLEPYMQPLQAAAVNESLGFTYARRRDFKRAAEAFADATRISPFDANNYYWWGEVLRRQGRFQDAVDKFRQALQRIPEGQAEGESQRECAAFKLRLAQIELGQDAEVKPQIDNHLRQPSPGGYWLLTAAAFALQHGDVPGATDAFQKARDALPTGQYALLTDDYFFHGFAEKPELVNFLPATSAEAKQKKRTQMTYFVDP